MRNGCCTPIFFDWVKETSVCVRALGGVGDWDKIHTGALSSITSPRCACFNVNSNGCNGIRDNSAYGERVRGNWVRKNTCVTPTIGKKTVHKFVWIVARHSLFLHVDMFLFGQHKKMFGRKEKVKENLKCLLK